MAIVVPSVTYGAYTYRSHRQRTAKAFGEFYKGVATAGSSQAQLECARSPIKTNLPVDDYWKDKWLFRPDATDPDDMTRIVQTYTPASGLLVPDLEWTNSPFHNGGGETFELHSVFNPTDLNDLINRGLKRCFVVKEFNFHAIPQQQEHNLGNMGYSWLREPAWIYQMGWLGPSDSRKQVNPFRRYVPGEPYKSRAGVVLDHRGLTFNATDRIYVLAIKPAYYECFSAPIDFGTATALATGVSAPITGSYPAATTTCWQLTVASTSGMQVGDEVELTGFTPAYFNGQYTVYSVDSLTQFSIEEPWKPGAVTIFGDVVGRHPQEGLTYDGDVCEIVEEWAAAASLIEGWTEYSHVLEVTANQRLTQDRKEAYAWFDSMVAQELLPHIPQRLFKKLLQWGPSWRWGSMGSLSVG